MSAAVLGGFLALLFVLDRHDLDPSALRWVGVPGQLAIYGLGVAAAFGCAIAPAGCRRTILLVAALVAAPIALGVWSAVWLGYAASVIAIARAPVHVLARVVASLVLWAAVPVARVVWLDGRAQVDTILLSILWAGQLYAALYLVIERERELPELRSTALADAFYLLALPRLVIPFFQPISPRLLASCERPEMPADRIRRAAGLAAYAAGLAVLAVTLGEVARQIACVPLALGVRFCQFYARVAFTIFTAIAVFRLLGFHLPSGFRTPFLSRSFAEFFRRYNYYVRDAVLSLFYFPLLGRLRHSLPPRAATIASAYVAIVDGLVPASRPAGPDGDHDRSEIGPGLLRRSDPAGRPSGAVDADRRADRGAHAAPRTAALADPDDPRGRRIQRRLLRAVVRAVRGSRSPLILRASSGRRAITRAPRTAVPTPRAAPPPPRSRRAGGRPARRGPDRGSGRAPSRRRPWAGAATWRGRRAR